MKGGRSMKLKIKMVSGEEYVFENNKYKDVKSWIIGNLGGCNGWFEICSEDKFLIRMEFIEKIEELSEVKNG